MSTASKTSKDRSWEADAELAAFVRDRSELRLGNYASIPDDVREHYGAEIEAMAGGYSYRQVLELIQNAADAILEETTASGELLSGRIVLRLSGGFLYAANTGAPLSKEGIIALLSAHSSSKRSNQIGRFGIGFKSLLGLKGRIDVFSRSISLRFDPEQCGKTIRDRLNLPASYPAPGLRIAWPVDALTEFESDEILSEMSQWATTIVRAKIGQERLVSHISEELDTFPGEFLLFLPADVDLELHSSPQISRKLARKRTHALLEHSTVRQNVKLIENGEESVWRVVETSVQLSDPEALADATTVHGRAAVPIAWALPLSVREERAGRFWAFFPTDTPTRVPGILNAPWKVNSDRTALIHGPYNTFLMKGASELIGSSLAHLATTEDPAKPLDLFPRELDSRDEVAQPLVEHIWDRLALEQIVPNGQGGMQGCGTLNLHPDDDEEAANIWWALASADQRLKFIHPTCHRGLRLNRLKFLLRRVNKEAECHVYLTEWLECIGSSNPDRARELFRLLKRIHEVRNDHVTHSTLRRAKIIPSEEGQIISALDAVISRGAVPSGKWAVHHAVVEDQEARQILDKVLLVRSLDNAQWEALLVQASKAAESTWTSNKDNTWKYFWDTLRGAPENVSGSFVGSLQSIIRVRSKSGAWEMPCQLLKPGGVISSSQSSERALVDLQYHADDGLLINALGVKETPADQMLAWSDKLGDAYEIYRRVIRSRYRQLSAQSDRNPASDYLDFKTGAEVLSGASLLSLLAPEDRVNLSTLLLTRAGPNMTRKAVFCHRTRPELYGSIEVPSPTAWLLVNYGVVELAGHGVTVADLAVARPMSWVQHLPGWNDVMTKLEFLLSAFTEDWPLPPGDMESLWPAVFAACENPGMNSDLRRESYEAGARHDKVPPRVCIQSKLILIGDCYVTSSDALASQAQKTGLPVVVLAPDAVTKWLEYGALNLMNAARIEYDSLVPEPLSLLDVVPEIAPVVANKFRETMWVRACQSLRLQIGTVGTPLPAAFDADNFLVDLQQLGSLPWQQRLTILAHEAGNAGWLEGDPEQIAKGIVQDNFIRRRADIAARPNLEERLMAAVGGNRDALLNTFDDAVKHAVQLKRSMNLSDLARLTLAVFGPTVLAVLEEHLDKEGLHPPNRWGTQESYEFATALGFPPDFGGSRSARRSAELWASGPMPLGSLHDYQVQLIHQLGQLIVKHEAAPARAILSLPTGSGKTRVAVEVAANSALNEGRMVLWIAQTDELCEQAVQSFRQVWANRGRAWTDLRIFRLWGGNPNPRGSDIGVPTVVVASIQTMTSRLAAEMPLWVRDASLVIIDEAHHAIAPSYTRLLKWLVGEQGDEKKTPPPLLGLSATPFRGRDEDESIRLANRFNGRLYPAPSEQADLYQRLQAQGILSEIITEPLAYSKTFSLTDAEKKQIETFDEFPDTAAQRMAEDEHRNDDIVGAVSRYADEGKQILLFANSVWHARHLAALFELKGIPAAAVHGGTDDSARQYFIKQFQNGTVKVLCNFAVLTTGFDAPRTDVIVISRPVFSPVRYMQMVGRGLRGEKNGGTATCRVVTVLDNIFEYSDRLAYHKYFMSYFQ